MEAHHFLSEEQGQEVKIIPFSLETTLDSPLENHINTLKKTINRIFEKELFSSELSDQLPIVKWSECGKVPGALFIYLLTTLQKKREIRRFFHEMVAHWLVPGDELQILSSKNLSFHLKEKGNRAYYFIELLVQVEKEKQLHFIQKNLPGLASEIKLGSHSKGYAQHILEMKRLSLGGKTSYIYETIVSVMRRRPKRFEHDIFREIQRFLIHCNETFREIREMRHLCRVIVSHYLFHKAIVQEIKKNAERRYLHFKLSKTHLHSFGLKKVVGLAITLNSLKEYECFEERHIMKAIQRILPHASLIEDSFYSHRHDEDKTLSLYLEFENEKDKDFSLAELILLKKKLGAELKNSIEYLSPSLFIPRNEEELYRNIITLSQELKYVHDLPQAIISFHEQRSDVLKFNIILLRILHQNDRSLQELSKELNLQDRFIQERVTRVGLLRKKYTKEANIFSLEIESKHFLRKNHSVDLVRARQYVVGYIEKLIGSFRDYNGGFLLKQNEQLESIKKEWSEEAKQYEYLIENLFYSITPSILQTLISPKAGKLFCDLFLKSIDLPLSNPHGLLFEKTLQESALACVIKCKQSDLKHHLNKVLNEVLIDPLKVGSASVEHEGFHYFCYLYLEPIESVALHFIDSLAKKIDAHLISLQGVQTLRLYLPLLTSSLDPRLGTDRTSGIVTNMLFEGLMRLGPSGKIVCALAESYTCSEDGKTYTFYLKETKWSNGYELAAGDFEYAWKKILDPSFSSPYCFLLFPIKNAEKAKKGLVALSDVGITVKNKRELVVELEYPASYFLEVIAHWTYFPLCSAIDQYHPGWAHQNSDTHVSNGPFKLEEWKPNNDVALIKNPGYWNSEAVKIDKIELSIIKDDDTAFEMYKKGALDWLGDPLRKLPLHISSELRKNETLLSDSQVGFFWLQLNIENPLFSNATLRRAFAYAINRSYLIEQVLQKEDEIALCFNTCHLKRKEMLFPDGDVELAKKLFNEGLKEARLEKSSLSTLVFTHSEIAEHERLTYEIGKMWSSAFGIEVRFERLLWNHYFDTLCKKQDFMVGGLSWYSRYEDPLYFLDLLIPRESTPILTEWKNQKFISLVESAKKENDPKQKEILTKEAELLAVEEMPLIPVLFDKRYYVKNPRLKGVTLSTIGQIDFTYAYFD